MRAKGNEMALQRLRDAAERAKIELSSTMETEINLPFHHGRRQRPETPGKETHARKTGVAWSKISSSAPCPRANSA